MMLDVGCGGSLGFTLDDSRASINCDLRKPMKRIQNFVLCDCHYLPFKDSLFSIVYFIDVVEHIFSPYRALLEIRRVLKIGGFIELGTPNALYLPKILRSILRGKYVARDHIATWGKTELEQLMFLADLPGEVEYTTYVDYPKPFYYNLPTKLCIFPALKHRHLLIKGIKKEE